MQDLLDLTADGRVDAAWVGLGTIAYELVGEFKPKIIVELGSFTGFSTFAMGLALRDIGAPARLYAVDTWQGDPIMGQFGEEVYETFLDNRRKLGLESIVHPLRMTFERAKNEIKERIDLLHIDGFHSFRAATSDFYMFRPLLSSGALVMFHDVYTYFRGMRLFWALISRRYPSYLIPYSHGLGIIQVS